MVKRRTGRLRDDDADEEHGRDAGKRERGPQVAAVGSGRFDGAHLKFETRGFTRVARLSIYLISSFNLGRRLEGARRLAIELRDGAVDRR